ncbi:MAG: hypothetical protein KZQ66_04215 [Candidatus Thiodiazotropha sp. (ex Lucinoma aequizonata)]|nr:hypothetical protein [Candidatus Thiodiazotropha sp. (ex Lucinoma aequizonata)]MCU7889062.1 hypothetical protein [Candidatus Thiodiazotropha sp. (ex Lucinoma aequizonata)]MCU7894595.1 hypothetical protein [Candidatus Thiodiazotropha sp. (ex Lucinoma aequizonata)]MCU7899975.1 hypothetical protein [Candidatus Thiodiazotropha sp. (ex Lucinoma aequizonata)]MCU7901299.1 hypothetical protein [Candidatus Thiodiazotropha sp. (ex Lucinoma aequizonata)]
MGCPKIFHGIEDTLAEGALNIVYGINDYLYNSDTHHLITMASCTTNCLAPVVKVMHEKIGILQGCMTTIHDINNSSFGVQN